MRSAGTRARRSVESLERGRSVCCEGASTQPMTAMTHMFYFGFCIYEAGATGWHAIFAADSARVRMLDGGKMGCGVRCGAHVVEDVYVCPVLAILSLLWFQRAEES